MSEASTRLADQSAGQAETLRPSDRAASRRGSSVGIVRRRGPRNRSTMGPGRWQSRLWDSTPPTVLVDEADRLIDRRDFVRASRVLAVAATTAPAAQVEQRRTILQRLAVTAADGGRHRISGEALFELQAIQPRDADTWVAFANVALARGNHVHADAAARAALAKAPDHRGAWAALAAGYAGLGWFDQAQNCLDRLDESTITDLERWRLGRAVNRWAMAGTRWAVIGAASALVVGVLAVAIGSTVPFLARDLRLRRLRSSGGTRRFESLASDAWRFERKLRIGHAAAVLTSVAAFSAVMLL